MYQEVKSTKATANYAKAHAEHYNPLYNAHRNDCTNFVSQCIEAGGFRMVRDPNNTSVGISKKQNIGTLMQ